MPMKKVYCRWHEAIQGGKGERCPSKSKLLKDGGGEGWWCWWYRDQEEESLSLSKETAKKMKKVRDEKYDGAGKEGRDYHSKDIT